MVWIGLVRSDKFRRDFVARTFALIAPIHTILHRVSCTYETIPNPPKHYAMHQNRSSGSNRVDSIRSLRKSRRDFVAWTFALIAPVHPVLHRVWCSYEMIPNAPKHYATHQNMSLGSNGVDRERSLRKILTRLRGTNFWINCTMSARFAPSFVRQRNDPKCTQRVRNAPKQEFRFQWGESGEFVAKNSDTTSWHELLY